MHQEPQVETVEQAAVVVVLVLVPTHLAQAVLALYLFITKEITND
jgi:hypothetical protein